MGVDRRATTAAAKSKQCWLLPCNKPAFAQRRISMFRPLCAQVMACCATSGCDRLCEATRAICCSHCSSGNHSRRCNRRMRGQLRAILSTCLTLGCHLLVAQGHTHCCATCRRTSGVQHKHSCKLRQASLVTSMNIIPARLPACTRRGDIDLNAMD